MSDTYKPWLESALYDLDVAILLHRHSKWAAACIHTQQAIEKFGKAILIFAGQRAEDTPQTHDLSVINQKIAGIGLHTFSERDQLLADQLTNDVWNMQHPAPGARAPHHYFSRLKSETSLHWALHYLDMTCRLIPNGIEASVGSDMRSLIKKAIISS